MKISAKLVLLPMLLLASHAAFGGELSATLTLTTDYVFDGVSQTDSNPAVQGSLDYSVDSGFYVGAWASNVDFGSGDNANAEIDYYAGYIAPLSDRWALDVGAIYYSYTGVPSTGYDYTELTLGLTANDNTTIQVWFSDDDDVFSGKAYRLKLTHSFALANDYALAVETTYVDLVDQNSDFLHIRAGILKSIKEYDLDLSFHNTNKNSSEDPDDLADARVVFSISRSF